MQQCVVLGLHQEKAGMLRSFLPSPSPAFSLVRPPDDCKFPLNSIQSITSHAMPDQLPVFQHRDAIWTDRWYPSESVDGMLEESRSYGRNGHSGQELVFADKLGRLGHMCKAGFVHGVYADAFQLQQSSQSEMQTLENAPNFLNSSPALPSIEDITYLLQKCRKKKNQAYAKHAHTKICSHGLDAQRAVGNYIVPMFVDCGCVSSAQQVFDRLAQRNEHSWTSLMSGFIQCGEVHLAFHLHVTMQNSGVHPSSHTLTALLKACVKLKDVEKGREIHIEIVQWGLECDVAVGSTLVDMYAKCGLLLEASNVFTTLPVRNVVSWTALIAGYADHGLGLEALNHFEQMQLEGIAPNAITFSCLLKAWDSVGAIDKVQEVHSKIRASGFGTDPLVGNTLVGMYAKFGFFSEAREVFDELPNRDVVSWNVLIAGLVEHGTPVEALNCLEQMPHDNIFPNEVTFTCIFKACGSIGAMEKGQQVHTEVIKWGFEKDPSVGNSLSGMYAKCGLLSEAVEVFDKLPVRDAVSWTALIAGYAKHGPGLEGLKCFEQMKLEGVYPNAFTFTCALRACGNIEALDSGRAIHEEIEWKGFTNDVHVGNTLVGMYAKCGSLLEAQQVFDKLPIRDIVSWNALITGYAEHGPGQEVLKCCEEMQANGFELDAVSFSCILKACGSIGAIEKGREVHAKVAEMASEIGPCVGNSLISMYAKCGSLSESQEVFDKLPVRDVMVWSSMIQAFGMNHAGNKAVQCFEEMQKQGVEPNAVTFTCLLSACSHASLAVEAYKYFKAMREEFGIAPAVEHYNCMVDLLARSGHLFEAEKFCEALCPPSEEALSALLTASRTCGETELGLRCFQQTVQMNPEDGGLYVLMADIHASAGRWGEAYRIEELRKHAGAMKKPATALIEVDHKVHEFVVGNNQSKEISLMLSSLSSRMREEGNVAHLDLVLRGISDVEKEVALCEHAEKCALAFGLLHSPQGETLRVTKNLRMCHECHNASKFISKTEKREIIIRDNCCIHRFKDGLCSCGDMF